MTGVSKVSFAVSAIEEIESKINETGARNAAVGVGDDDSDDDGGDDNDNDYDEGYDEGYDSLGSTSESDNEEIDLSRQVCEPQSKFR